MNIFYKIFFTLLALLTMTSSVYASDISDPRIEKVYNNLIEKVEKQFTPSEQVVFLEKLGDRIDLFFDTKSISENNIIILSDINKLNNEQLFKIDFNQEKEKTQSSLLKYASVNKFTRISENIENIFKENDVWYFYDFKTTHFFEENNVDISTLSHNNIDINTDLVVLRENGGVGFVTDFEKVKLISDTIIYGIPDKYEFLKEVRNDQRHLRTNNTDLVFSDMKNTVENITTSTKKQDKIASIYAWMLDNLDYTEDIDLDDRKIFSGSETYNNRDGVCEGYTKVMMYMLNFAGIRDSVVIRGDVINATDFPNIGHAWVRVGEEFYDPTFDDPIGATKTRTAEKYRYYKLPKDLMYTNRFDFGKTPKALESTNLSFREKLVGTKLFALTKKYSSEDYIVLQPAEFRKSLGLTFDDDIGFSELKEKTVYLEVGSDFSTTVNGVGRFLQSFQYYPIARDGSNIESLLNQLSYDLRGYYLMKFYREGSSGEFDYRLAYNVSFR